MTVEDTQKSIWSWMTSVPAKIAGVIAAIIMLVGFAISGGKLIIEVHAFTKRGTAAMEKVEKVEHELKDLTVSIEGIQNTLDEFKKADSADATPPIRFAEFGSEVEPTTPGGIATVKWLLWVQRTDCPPPELALNMEDVERIIRPVALGDFRPVKLEKGLRPIPISYEVIAPKQAHVGLGILWAEVQYECSGRKFALRSPSIQWRIVKPDE